MKDGIIDRFRQTYNMYLPVIVTVYSFSLFFLLYVIKPGYVSIFYPCSYWDYPVYTGIGLTLGKRLILLSISGITFFPCWAFSREHDSSRYPRWVELGVAVGLIGLLIVFIALPQSLFNCWSLDIETESVFDYNTNAIITMPQMHRLLIVNNVNVILSLDVLIFGFTISELRCKKKLYAYISSNMLLLASVISLISDFGNAKYMSCLSGGCACCAMLICCISSMKNEEHHLSATDEERPDRKTILACGVLLCFLYFERVLSSCLFESYSIYKAVGSCTSLLSLIILFCYAISCKKDRQRQTSVIKMMPLFLLLIGLFGKEFYFVDPNIDEKIYLFLVPYLAVNGYCYNGTECNCMWFLEGLSCFIYTIYILYNYRTKNRWWLCFILPLAIAILLYVPDFTIPVIEINTITLLDIGIGAASPVCLLLTGIREVCAENRS